MQKKVLVFFFALCLSSHASLIRLSDVICNNAEIEKEDIETVLDSIDRNNLDAVLSRFGDVFFNRISDFKDFENPYVFKILRKTSDSSSKKAIAKRIIKDRSYNSHTIHFLNNFASLEKIYDLYSIDFEDIKILNEDVLRQQIRFAIYDRDYASARSLAEYLKSDRNKRLFEEIMAIDFDKFLFLNEKEIKKYTNKDEVLDLIIVEKISKIKNIKLLLNTMQNINYFGSFRPEKWVSFQLFLTREVFFFNDFDYFDKREALGILFKNDENLNNEDFIEKNWLTGFLKFEFFKDEDAFEFFEKNLTKTEYSMSKSRNYYWLARFYKENDNFKHNYYLNLAAEFPLSFYGQVAINELGLDLKSALKSKIYHHNADNVLKNNELFSTGEELLDMDCNNSSRTFFSLFFRSEVDDTIKSHGLRKINNLNHDLGGFFGRFATRMNVFVPEISYPFSKHTKDILKNAIMRQETQFGLVVEDSNKGARGIMQIIPSTAKMICKSKKISFDTKKLKNDPKYNIKIADIYLKDLFNKFNDHNLLFAAYNAGPGVVNKWVNIYKKDFFLKDDIFFIEMIPYKETRNYIMRVREAYNIYEALF